MSYDGLMALQLKILFKYIRLVMSTVKTNCHSRKHTEIACICRAVIGVAHMTLLTVEIKIITGILALIILAMTAMSLLDVLTSFIPKREGEMPKYRNM